MELSKQDKRHIDDQVKKLQMRMHCEATEYAHLCERYYYEQMIAKCKEQLDIIDTLHDNALNYANSQTQ